MLSSSSRSVATLLLGRRTTAASTLILKRYASVSARPSKRASPSKPSSSSPTKPSSAPTSSSSSARTFQLKSASAVKTPTSDKTADKPSSTSPLSNATSTSTTTDKVSTASSKPSSPPLPTIPFDTPSIMDDLVDLDSAITPSSKTSIPSTALPSAKTSPLRSSPTSRTPSPSRSSLPSSSSASSADNNSKEVIKDLKSQLSQLTKERNSLKQSLGAIQQEQGALLQERSAWQSQTAQLSALEAIYGDAGLGQLKALVKELTPEETATLKVAGFDIEGIDSLLEQRLKDLVVQFTIHTSNDVAKIVNTQLKRLRDLHKQSTSAATATQQTLKNANLPEAVIVGSVASLQLHLDEIQAKLARWEKLKADVDLLLATHQ